MFNVERRNRTGGRGEAKMTDEINKEKNEEDIFEEAKVEKELPESAEVPTEADEEPWNPTISGESPKAKLERIGKKEEADGKVVTIKEVFFTKPQTKGQDGTKLEPKLTQNSSKPYYSGKLGVRFDENNLVEYYPTMRYFVNNGVVSNSAKLNRVGESQITKLVNLVVAKLNKPLDEISDQEILDYMIGKKVKLKTARGTYANKKWFRNDIVEFV